MLRSVTKQLLAVVVCGYLAVVAGCQQPNVYEPPPPPTVTVAKPLQRTVTNFLEETGTTEPVARVDLRARVSGFLEQVNFEPGTDVEEGQVLYVIEQEEYEHLLAAAQADLLSKQAEKKRAIADEKRERALLQDNATAVRNLELAEAQRRQAEADVKAAEAAVDQAELDLKYTKVWTPISGRVSKTMVKAGNLVGEADATLLATIVNYDPIYANFNISERAMLELMGTAKRTGANRQIDYESIKMYLRRANDEGFPFEGHLDYLDLAVDQSTGTYMVRGIFPNPHKQIVPGLFVRIRLPTGIRENALLVPERALGADQGGRYLLAVNSENKVERRNITVGPGYTDLVVIEEGLRPDDLVIIDGIQRARPGAEVTVEQTELTVPEGQLETLQLGSESPLDQSTEAAQPEDSQGAEEESAAAEKAQP